MSLLTCQNLTIKINNKIICDNFQFEICAGDRIGILGANGCGKTTFLQTLAGLYSYTSGEIFLTDRNIKLLSRKQIALRLGILFQDTTNSFEQTVEEHCLLGRFAHDNSAQDQAICHQALASLQLMDLRLRKISSLSGGERRRLAIAVLLTQAPQIFLLDEPTNHLDLHYQLSTLEMFSTFTQRGICMSLHDVRLAKVFCNKILLFFPDGEIVQGAPEKILTQKNLSRLYSLSSHWLPMLNM